MLSSPWEVRFSSSRQHPYFFNTETNQSSWDPPANLSEAEVAKLPGADKYLSKHKNGDQAGAARAQTGQAERDRQQQQRGKLRASHILAKHVGSRRPSSWREVSGGGHDHYDLIAIYQHERRFGCR